MSSSKIIRNAAAAAAVPFALRDMDDTPQPREDAMKEELQQARNQAAEILHRARSEKESIEMDAYNQGIKQGQEQGQKMALKRIAPLFDALQKALDELPLTREQYQEQHEDQMIALVLQIAEKVIHREVKTSPDLIRDTIRAACEHLRETDEVRVRLHPSDFEYVREVEEMLTRKLTGRRTVQVIEDASLQRGGTMIETDFGDIDATIAAQFAQLAETLTGS